MKIIIAIILVFAIFGVITFFALRKLINSTGQTLDEKSNKAETTQDDLPFKYILDGVIDLGGHDYRAVIKCSSINYDLKTDKEKYAIELSFQRFLNSLTHPISFFIQTKQVDNTDMLKTLKKDIEESISEFDELKEYGNVFYSNMESVYNQISSDKEKNKYIIVPFNEALALDTLNDDEKYEYSIKEIQTRCQIIIENLKGIGIYSTILGTNELIDLIYSSYNRDNASQIKNITSGEFLKMTVEGEDRLAEITDEGKFDWILYEAQSKIQTELLNNDIPDDLRDRGLDAITELSKIRNALAGEFQYTFNIEEKLDFK
ncbi:MAG: hypothetical protein GX889_11940 [Clostridiales bacterium]|nr:hypothetical protein [Clostridiales bacterium]